MCFETDAAKSLRGFEKFTAPVLKAAFGTNKIYSTERHDNELAKVLDRNAGIDGFVVDRNGAIFAFASRVQVGRNFQTFSIRRSRPSGKLTEFNKLANALQLKPSYHVQTFVDADEQAATVALAETPDVIEQIYRNPNQWRTTSDNETFFFIPWRNLDNVQIFRIFADGRLEKKKTA